MGLFGGKNLHNRQVDRLIHLATQLFEMTTELEEVSPHLRFERPDSLFRYMLFCLGTVHVACAPLEKNPDAVLNEAGYAVVNCCIQEMDTFFGEKLDPQEAANRAVLLQDFLHRWSAWVDITEGGNVHAGNNIVATMIHDCESAEEISSSDTERLVFVASWIVTRFPDARKVFRNA